MSCSTSYGQQVFKRNADGFKLGTYKRDDLLKDWNTKSGNGFVKKNKGEDRVEVVNSPSGESGQSLRVRFPKKKHDSKESGAQWETDLKGGYDELYMSYDVRFQKGFELSNKTGKLPGLGGGLSVDDKDDDNTAWDGKLQFRDVDELEFYIKGPVTNEKHFTWNKAKYTIQTDKWYNIEIRYKLNTANKSDGIMQAWLDGRLVGEVKNFKYFRKNNNVKINKMFFSTFYGGNEKDEPSKDVYAYFDNFEVSTSRINKSGGGSGSTPPSECSGTGKSISSKIQAESYCKSKGVSKKSNYVSLNKKNDYIDFRVNVPSSGKYSVKYRVASAQNTGRGSVRLKVGNSNKGDKTIPKTGGATKWKTITKNVNLSKGSQTIRLQTVNGAGWNLDYFELKRSTSGRSEIAEKEVEEDLTVNNGSGALLIYPNPSIDGLFTISSSTIWTVRSLATGAVIATGEGTEVDISNQSKGLYLLQIGNEFSRISFK